MRNSINDALQTIKKHSKFAVFTHKNPDGDAIGGVLAFSEMLREMGKEVSCFVDLPIKDAINISEKTQEFCNNFVDDGYDCYVAIDCGSLDHLYLGETIPQNKELLVVDHHYTNTLYGTVNYVLEDASSVGEVIFDIVKESSVKRNIEISNALYMSIVSDTWYFSFANTTPKAMNMVAELISNGVDFMALNEIIKAKSLQKFNLTKLAYANSVVIRDGRAIFMYIPGSHDGEDTEGIVDSARNVKGCLFAALSTQISKDTYKVSLRSNVENVDVSVLASRFGGGGHKRASGFTFNGQKSELEKILENYLDESLND